MEKHIPYIIITILLVIIASGVTYIVMDKQNDKTEVNDNKPSNKENNTNEIKEDGVKLTTIKEENDKIVETFEIVLNNKKSNVEIEYEYNFIKDYLGHKVIGKFNNNILFNIEYININNQGYTKSNTFNVDNIKSVFNENNFNIIKGTDNKNYLLIQTMWDGMDIFNTSELYVYNENLELISNNIIAENESPDYESHNGFIIDNFSGNIPCEYENNSPLYVRTFKKVNNEIDDRQYTKIENNQIYFLFPKITDEHSGILEERIYTIKDSKLTYKVGKTYKFNSICQQI